MRKVLSVIVLTVSTLSALAVPGVIIGDLAPGNSFVDPALAQSTNPASALAAFGFDALTDPAGAAATAQANAQNFAVSNTAAFATTGTVANAGSATTATNDANGFPLTQTVTNTVYIAGLINFAYTSNRVNYVGSNTNLSSSGAVTNGMITYLASQSGVTSELVDQSTNINAILNLATPANPIRYIMDVTNAWCSKPVVVGANMDFSCKPGCWIIEMTNANDFLFISHLDGNNILMTNATIHDLNIDGNGYNQNLAPFLNTNSAYWFNEQIAFGGGYVPANTNAPNVSAYFFTNGIAAVYNAGTFWMNSCEHCSFYNIHIKNPPSFGCTLGGNFNYNDVQNILLEWDTITTKALENCDGLFHIFAPCKYNHFKKMVTVNAYDDCFALNGDELSDTNSMGTSSQGNIAKPGTVYPGRGTNGPFVTIGNVFEDYYATNATFLVKGSGMRFLSYTADHSSFINNTFRDFTIFSAGNFSVHTDDFGYVSMLADGNLFDNWTLLGSTNIKNGTIQFNLRNFKGGTTTIRGLKTSLPPPMATVGSGSSESYACYATQLWYGNMRLENWDVTIPVGMTNVYLYYNAAYTTNLIISGCSVKQQTATQMPAAVLASASNGSIAGLQAKITGSLFSFPTPAIRNIQGGTMTASGDSVPVNQGTTNVATLTAFTATFQNAFPDTNYVATASGNGFALAGEYVSNKTTTNCVFNMTAATGLIDWMAIHQ